MPKVKLFAIALAAAVCVGVPQAQAQATDPCNPTVMGEMATAASQGFNRYSDVAVTFMKPPSPAASSNCLRGLMNVWQIDPAMMAGAFFPTGTLGYTIGGFTLSHSSPAKIVLELANNWFNSNFGSLICGELWGGIGEALRPLKFNPDGSINIGASLSGNISGISGLASVISIANGGTAQINFPGGFTGSFTMPPD